MYRLDNGCCFSFLEQIKDNSVDLVLTDPPYLISRDTGFSHGNNPAYDRLKVSMDFGEWDHTFNELSQVIAEFYRVLRPGGTCIIFYDLWKISYLKEWLTSHKFQQPRFIEWLKTNPVPLNQHSNYLTNARECAVTAVKGGKPTFHSQYDKGVYEHPIEHTKDRFHPTQKSLKLFEALVLKHTNPGDLVLDPFAGSATTGVAAIRHDRVFIGCEIDPDYYEKALIRLNNTRPGSGRLNNTP